MTLVTLEVFDKFKEHVLQKLREQKRVDKGWAADISEKSGLSIQAVYSLAGGQRGTSPEYSTIFKLAMAMGWSMEDIADELFPDRAGAMYRLVRERPRVLEHLSAIMDKGRMEDLEKIEADLAYMASRLG